VVEKLAVIGTGIAGMYCAYRLHLKFDLTVYEKNDYAGGHTNTVEVAEGDRRLPIDTGFMVYNRVTYPNLIRLFDELQVPVKPAPMSFSVQHRPTGLEFCGSGLNGLFAQRRNLFRPAYWRLLRQIDRFNREAPALLDDPAAGELTLADYAREAGFSRELLDYYLIPMSSAVWSTPADEMLRFPAVTLIRFFKNHGFLGLNTQHPWLTVDGGSRVYRDKITAPYRDRLRVASPVERVERQDGKVWVTEASGQRSAYDVVIMASHADETLRMLDTPTPDELMLLSRFRYQTNIATLHTDEAVMPRTRGCWSSWNYAVTSAPPHVSTTSTIYWMNSLQGVSDQQNYFVSINGQDGVAPGKVIRKIVYTHPVFSVKAIGAQQKLSTLNDRGPIYYCGSYFRYGFHEDALVSAMDVVKRLS